MEALLELLAELVINVGFEWLFGALGRPRVTRRGLWAVCLIVLGAGLGWASTALVARPLIPWIPGRVAYVIVVPPLVAWLIDTLARRRAANGRPPGLIDNWLDAYLFALAFSVARFFTTL